MRFLCLYKTAQPEATPPSQREMEAMGTLIEEMTKAGVLLGTEGCQPSTKGARVRLADGKITVTDGPFTESKELVAGFALIQVDSMDEAIRWTRRFLQVAGDGETEIRALHEAGDCGQDRAERLDERQAAPVAARV
jgi:hypothetical protein